MSDEPTFGVWQSAWIGQPDDIPDGPALVYDGRYEIASPVNKSDNIWATGNEWLACVTHWMPLPPPPSHEREGE